MDKQIEEMEKDIAFRMAMAKGVAGSMNNGVEGWLSEYLIERGWAKIPEGAVVIPKEISCYDNVEEGIRTFNLGGNKVYFTDKQIMAITSIFHFHEMHAKEIRKETAEKFAEMAKAKARWMRDHHGDYTAVDIYDIDEIANEIKEGKV